MAKAARLEPIKLSRRNIVYIRIHVLPESEKNILERGAVVKNRWEIEAKLGEGAHSEVYCALDRELDIYVALKVNTSKMRLLSEEADILRSLKDSIYFCRLIDNTIHESLRVLAMDMKGPSLDEVNQHYGPLSAHCVLQLSLQMLDAIRDLHLVGFIHGDIKPKNFVTGLPPDEMNRIFLIDFSLSKRFISKKNRILPPNMHHTGFPGTMKYASPLLHQTRQLSRRDDLYSMLYTMLELRGELPWNKIQIPADVLEEKLKMTDGLLKERLGNAIMNLKYLICKMQYTDNPDYNNLKLILESSMKEHRVDEAHEGKFVWEMNPGRIWRIEHRDSSGKSLVSTLEPTKRQTNTNDKNMGKISGTQNSPSVKSANQDNR